MCHRRVRRLLESGGDARPPPSLLAAAAKQESAERRGIALGRMPQLLVASVLLLQSHSLRAQRWTRRSCHGHTVAATRLRARVRQCHPSDSAPNTRMHQP